MEIVAVLSQQCQELFAIFTRKVDGKKSHAGLVFFATTTLLIQGRSGSKEKLQKEGCVFVK